MREEERGIETQKRVRLIEPEESRGLKWHTDRKWTDQSSHTMKVKTLEVDLCSVAGLVRLKTLMKVV